MDNLDSILMCIKCRECCPISEFYYESTPEDEVLLPHDTTLFISYKKSDPFIYASTVPKIYRKKSDGTNNIIDFKGLEIMNEDFNEITVEYFLAWEQQKIDPFQCLSDGNQIEFIMWLRSTPREKILKITCPQLNASSLLHAAAKYNRVAVAELLLKQLSSRLPNYN